MLSWALTFLVLAVIAGVLGLTGLAGAAANIAWILFVVGLIIAIPSVLGFLLTGWSAPGRPPGTVGLVNLPALALISAASMPATTIGVRLAHALDPRPLKRVFAVFIAMMALNMLRRAIWG